MEVAQGEASTLTLPAAPEFKFLRGKEAVGCSPGCQGYVRPLHSHTSLEGQLARPLGQLLLSFTELLQLPWPAVPGSAGDVAARAPSVTSWLQPGLVCEPPGSTSATAKGSR